MNSPYRKTTLDNGVRVITYPMANRQSAAIGVWLKVGGRYESKANKGIAHFLEHMCFKGSQKYSCRRIKESIEGIGGALNGFTSEELTCYLAKLPASHMGLVLDILTDMAMNPLLAEDEIEKERTVILEEMKMYKDLPQAYVYDLLDELLWPDHPLGMGIIGYAESVGKVKKQDLSLFKEKHYTPLNIVLSACGHLDHDDFTGKVKDIFSGLKSQNINTDLEVKEKQDSPKLNIFYKDTEQAHMALGFHSLKRGHPAKHALGMLNIILGANMSSRLFDELREKRGLCYEIGTQVKRFRDTGAFIVHVGMDNLKVNEALELILKELDKIKRDQVSSDEFRRAKEFYIGQLMLSLEDTLDHMLWIGDSTAVLDETYSLEEIIREVNLVKPQDILEVAAKIFQENNLNLALISPLKDSQDKIRSQLHF